MEFDHTDPLFQRSVAVTGVIAYRGKRIKQLRNKLLFGDNHGGEIFYVAAIRLPEGGQDAIRRVVFEDKGSTKTLLQLVQERMYRKARRPQRGPICASILAQEDNIYVINKADGVIRRIEP